MATATVIISNVRLIGTNTLVPGSVVGADPWNDADAGTYTENTASFRTHPSVADAIETGVGDLSLPVAVSTLASITLEADFTSTNSGSTGAQHAVSVAFYDEVGEFVTNFTGSVDGLAGGVMETVTSSATTLGSNPDTLTAFLLPSLNGGTVRVGRFGNADGGVPADYTVRCHRLVLTIEYNPDAIRLYPRDDGRGIGNSPRIHPPTKANRIVGGYQ